LIATMPIAAASFSAPESGELASRIVLAASGLPFLVPPFFASTRCQATIASGVRSRTLFAPSNGRT
jgi:hypothetical protein